MNNYKDVFNLKLFKNCLTSGDFDFPTQEPCYVMPENIISFNYAKNCKEPEKYFIHFYIDDYQFERIWKKPYLYLTILSRFAGVITPDFSVYKDMPKAQQIWQVYRQRLIANFYQKNGLLVIPNVTWADEKSLEWTLQGLPKNSIIALSTNGCLNKWNQPSFINCFNLMLHKLNPKKIIVIGSVPDIIKNEKVIYFSGHIEKVRKLQRSK